LQPGETGAFVPLGGSSNSISSSCVIVFEKSSSLLSDKKLASSKSSSTSWRLLKTNEMGDKAYKFHKIFFSNWYSWKVLLTGSLNSDIVIGVCKNRYN